VFSLFLDAASAETHPLSLHDALPIWSTGGSALTVGTGNGLGTRAGEVQVAASGSMRVNLAAPERSGPEAETHQVVHIRPAVGAGDRKSTRLNSSHLGISYAVFCLKKK